MAERTGRAGGKGAGQGDGADFDRLPLNRAGWLPRLAMVLCGSLIGLLLAEAAARLAPGLFRPGAVRTHLELDALQKREEERWKAVGLGPLYVGLPEHQVYQIGHPGITYRYYGFEYAAEIHYNSLGIRDREPPAPGSSQGCWMVVGDSFVEGRQLAPEDTLPGQLEALLLERGQSWRVVNAGIGGTGTVNQYQLAKYLGPFYRPQRLILVFYVGNDLVDNSLPLATYFVASRASARIHRPLLAMPLRRGYYWRTAQDEGFQYVAPGANIDWLGETGWFRAGIAASVECSNDIRSNPGYSFLNGLSGHSALAGALRDGFWNVTAECEGRVEGVPVSMLFETTVSNERVAETWQATAYLFSRFKELAEDLSTDLTVVLLPSRIRIDERERKKTLLALEIPEKLFSPEGPESRLRNLLESLGVACLDLTPQFQNHPDPASLYLPIDGHLNAAGQRFVARQIIAALDEKRQK